MVCLFLQGGHRMRTEDIVNRVFTRSFMGYDIEEVDRFLDEVIDAIEQYEAEKKEMMTAMEYLMQKIEDGERPPADEMRDAIDSGGGTKKRTALPERTQDVRIPAKRTDRSASAAKQNGQNGAKAKTARSIATGGSGTPKPVRAPKVKRVAPQQKQETEAERPATPLKREDWLDELLDNLSERDKQGYTEQTAQPAAQNEAAPEATQAQAVVETPKAQPAPEATQAQAAVETPKAQPAPEATKAQAAYQPPITAKPEQPKTQSVLETPEASGESIGLKEHGPQQEPSAEEAFRSFEQTLRTLGEQPRTEPQQPDSKITDEIPEHMPKHAAVPEEKES